MLDILSDSENSKGRRNSIRRNQLLAAVKRPKVHPIMISTPALASGASVRPSKAIQDYSTTTNYYLLITIFKNLLRRKHPCRAHHSAARMRAARAEVVAFEWGTEVCPLRHGTQEEDLMEQQFAVEDVAARDARDGFDVLRRDDLHADNRFADVRRVLLNGRDDHFAKLVSLRVVPATFDVVGRVLYEARYHMLTRPRHVGVDHRWENHVEIWALRDPSILGIIVGALDVVNARTDRHRAAM